MSLLRVFRTNDNQVIAQSVIPARSPLQRLVGLLRHQHLRVDAGLWLVPGGSVHTIGMRFPIDVVFLDRQHHVLKTRTQVFPHRFCMAPKRTHSTLELAAGRAAQLNLLPGQHLVFAP